MSNLVFEKISQALTAAKRLEIGIAGSFLRLSECAWPVTVTLLKGGRVIGSMSNMQAGDYVDNVEFDGVLVVNGATEQTVGIQIADGGAGSNRVLGEVAVIDGGRARTISGQAFIGQAWQPGVAGQYPHVQILNQAGSGKNVVIEGFAATGAAAGYINIRDYSTALTLASNGKCKKIGGAASSAELRVGSNASVLGGSPLIGAYMAASGNYSYKFNEPIILVPGQGILGQGALAADLTLAFEFFEELV